MPRLVALAFGLLIAAILLRIERKRPVSTSFALWLPFLWMFLSASRPLSRWLDLGAGPASEGSLPDRLALALMILLGAVVLRGRSVKWLDVFRDNFWLFAFFAYIGISVLWTDVPFVALKRWIKSSGVIVMALIVISEPSPLLAFERILRRCAYILLPLSVVFIKYFPDYGRAYGWDGVEMWTGVTTQKNSLGALCAVSAVMVVVDLLRKRHDDEAPLTWAQRGADLFALATACFLLRGSPNSYSATAIAIAGFGVGVSAFFLLRRQGGLLIVPHLKGLLVACTAVYLLFGDALISTGAQLLGRRGDLTGRATEIWPFVMQEAARHPILGSGYGGVWGLGNQLSRFLGLEQAHNGYLDVYLQLGIVGCILLGLFLLEFCARTRRQFTHDRAWGVFGVAFLFMNLMYNLSETAFFDVYLGSTLVMMSVVFSADGEKHNALARDLVPGLDGPVKPAGWDPTLVKRLADGRRSASSVVARESAYEWPARRVEAIHKRAGTGIR